MNDAKRHSVLIVDDENSNIMALTHILSPEYTIYAAKSGASALAAVEKYSPDVILLDIVMPEMDGYDVIAALKASEKSSGIPVVFVTGLSNADDEEKGLILGAADYIAKPLSPAIVKLRVRNQVKMLDQLRIIERLSMLDQLTNLPNRRNYELRLKEEWRRARRDREPIGLLMIDADSFKHYNDTYGHQQGDAALQAIAGTLTEVLKRSGDFAARWGGEEFIVLLPNTDLTGASEVAEQIRVALERMDIPCPDGRVTKITASIGVNTWEYGQSDTIDGFLSGADTALYNAKSGGRNRVSCFKRP